MGHFVQLDAADHALEGGIESDSNIALEHLTDKKSRKLLTGAKMGDVRYPGSSQGIPRARRSW
jgi:hypothetical protein